MMNDESGYILALDQGTTSSRSLVFDEEFEMVTNSQQEFKQIYPQNGWVEHDPETIWKSQLTTAKVVLENLNQSNKKISGIGITNQRETTIVWNKTTGKPVYNAIVWQDRRTHPYCDGLINGGHNEMVQSKTGLLIDAYFSASKVKWILDNVPGAQKSADQNELLFGTVDTWLIWRLTNGKQHITDVSNASRTMLFNIHTLSWDQELLKLFNIPKSMLPTVVNTCGYFGVTDKEIFGQEIPITGIMGDQQAALFGQMCVKKGMVKSTYGTGCFLMLNTGNSIINSTHKMLSTIGWKINEEISYALEGSVFIGGAVIQWLRDEMEFFVEASHSEDLAEAANDNGGIYFVPALTGLGAPYWDANATGAIFGITRSTSKSHLTRAALESICYQVNDVIQAMNHDVDFEISELRVDGGAAANSLLVQFQADVSNISVVKPSQLETTALGVAFMASIGLGKNSIKSLQKSWALDQTYHPNLDRDTTKNMLNKWSEAVKRSLNWPS
ncbi:MAG: glycerol kinase GlpK [Salibacteraceae bacterium]